MLLGIAASAVGCSKYDASVRGSVSLDGTPLERGTVKYASTSDGPSAYGQVDSSGNYRLKTGREKGLPPGEYSVTVVAREAVTDWNGEGPPPPGKAIVPPWYRTPQHSSLKFNVGPGDNEINLELKSEAPESWQSTQKKRRRRR